LKIKKAANGDVAEQNNIPSGVAESIPVGEASSASNRSKLLLDREQLAHAINVSSRTVSNWQSSGKIPYLKLSERCVRFVLPDVLRALQRFEVKEARR
jgi:hypothetical protein